MSRRVWIALALTSATAAVHCSSGSVDLEDRQCPCIAGWVCDASTNRCRREVPEKDASVAPRDASTMIDATTTEGADAQVGADAGGDCSVHTDDRRLHCTNRRTPVYAQPDPTSEVIDELRTPYSYFECWTTGARNADGSTTWYQVFGDNGNKQAGYVPASAVDTNRAFTANPAAFGFHQCGK